MTTELFKLPPGHAQVCPTCLELSAGVMENASPVVESSPEKAIGENTEAATYSGQQVQSWRAENPMTDQALFLLVEDNPDHVLLLQRAFKRAKILNPLQVVRSGEEAIEYLAGKGKYSNRAEFPPPALVLLDLKMPGIDGFDLLRWIRHEQGMAGLRVVVLTTSDDARDVDRAYKLGANSFLVKPTDFDRFVEISQALNGYWVWLDESPGLARLPLPAVSTRSEAHQAPAK